MWSNVTKSVFVFTKLDGISVTTRIRQFDERTPIVLVTEPSEPTDVMSHWMSDVLPRPITNEAMIEMLEVLSSSIGLVRYSTELIIRTETSYTP
jgi:CheY-like chemotaxis protein